MVKAVRQDLRVLRRSAPGVGDASLEALALSLARELDNTKTSATSKSMCARALLDTLERLRSLSAEEETDGLDDLSARRAARRRAAP
jgi:hypothetical protein